MTAVVGCDGNVDNVDNGGDSGGGDDGDGDDNDSNDDGNGDAN